MTNDPQAPDHLLASPSLWERFKRLAAYDPVSRAYHSFLQAFVAVAFVGGVVPGDLLGSVPWYAALIAGAGAAVSSVVLSVATWKTPKLSVPLDTAVRLVRTYVGVLGGLYAASGLTVVTFGWKGALLAAATSTVGSLIKTYLVNGAAGGNDMVAGKADSARDAGLTYPAA